MPAPPRAWIAALLALALVACGEKEEPDVTPSGPKSGLIERLREGGHVLVIRHTTTETTTDRPETIGDCATQRNLNEQGRREARDTRAAMEALGIPVGDVRASPLCRTRETAQLMFGRVTVDRGLVSPGVIGSEADDRRRAQALRRRVATVPVRGNLMLVTHTGNIGDAFGESVLEGEALVFRPGEGTAGRPVGRLTLEDWQRLRGGG